MAIVMRMRWSGVTPEQYDQVRRTVDWVHNTPDGAHVHLASFDQDGVLQCFDVWESEAQLNEFLSSRIMPAVQQVGVQTAPEVQLDPCHELFIARAGTTAIPEQSRVMAATPL